MIIQGFNDWEKLFRLDWPELWPYFREASRLRQAHFGRQVSFCVIINAKSGYCSEDCAFCSQGATSRAGIVKYPLLPQEKLLAAAQEAAAQGAARFSLVTSGRGIVSPREREAILAAITAIRREVPLQVCASLGIVDRPFLEELKSVGVYRFHHNLETAASFFSRICTTHTYKERLDTVAAAKAAGLAVCSGGILGMGETLAQRFELAQALKELEVDAVPLNFLHPLPGTGLASRPLLPPLEALKIITAFRLTFPDKSLIICGGRQPTLRSLAPLMFAAGANALMTGDYLTTKGRLPAEDRQMLEDLGLELEIGGGQGPQVPGPPPTTLLKMKLPKLPRLQGVFVTGTDTGVGKTWVSAGITAVWRRQGRRAVYFKPIQSGCPEVGGRLIPTDARFAQELAGLQEPLELLSPIALRLPLAPGVAARQEGIDLNLEKVAECLEKLAESYDLFVVEGAGGLYVPLIGTSFLVLDLVRWLNLPLVVVARAGLGTINHTALTVTAARQAGLPVAGVIINRYPAKPSLAEQTNPEVIAALTQAPILGLVPELADINTADGKQAFLEAMQRICSQPLFEGSGARGQGSGKQIFYTNS